MKISVKTLNGELFQIDVDAADKVGDLKRKIQENKPALLLERQKLIHSGKVLKDEQTVSELGLAESDFIVCMITKEIAKKAQEPVKNVAAPVAPPVVAPTTVAPPAQTPPNIIGETTSQSAEVSKSATATENSEALQALVNMGFPEKECKAALAAAHGNPDLAYEFLLTGVPDNSVPSQIPSSQSPASIEQLRSHPQFNTLKRVVQENPAALSQVLDLIGQQNPALLAAIHANNDAFLAMMNEPIADTTQPSLPTPSRGTDAAQMVQFLGSLPPEQRAMFAQSMGMTPEQLQGFINMMSTIPSSDLNNILRNQEDRDHDPPGVIRLTHEEMAAVNRLVALGFSQQQAAQAYLACDKNEALAANLLLEGGWAEDGDDYGDEMNEDNYH